jgi:hypothetical protein
MEQFEPQTSLAEAEGQNSQHTRSSKKKGVGVSAE